VTTSRGHSRTTFLRRFISTTPCVRWAYALRREKAGGRRGASLSFWRRCWTFDDGRRTPCRFPRQRTLCFLYAACHLVLLLPAACRAWCRWFVAGRDVEAGTGSLRWRSFSACLLPHRILVHQVPLLADHPTFGVAFACCFPCTCVGPFAVATGPNLTLGFPVLVSVRFVSLVVNFGRFPRLPRVLLMHIYPPFCYPSPPALLDIDSYAHGWLRRLFFAGVPSLDGSTRYQFSFAGRRGFLWTHADKRGFGHALQPLFFAHGSYWRLLSVISSCTVPRASHSLC